MLGDNGIDEYHYGTIDRISPEAPVPVFKFSHKEFKPGMAANVKENLLALGCKVDALLGQTSRKVRLIDVKSKQHIVRIDEDHQSLDPLPHSAIDSYLDYDAVVVSDYNKGWVTYDLIESLLVKVNVPIFVDTKKTDLERFEGCFVKINEVEHNLAKSLCSNLIITLGDRGASYNDNIFPAAKTEVVDVCGAGDTFLAALAFKYLDVGDIHQAIRFAIKASTITIQHTGVYAPKLEEIE